MHTYINICTVINALSTGAEFPHRRVPQPKPSLPLLDLCRGRSHRHGQVHAWSVTYMFRKVVRNNFWEVRFWRRLHLIWSFFRILHQYLIYFGVLSPGTHCPRKNAHVIVIRIHWHFSSVMYCLWLLWNVLPLLFNSGLVATLFEGTFTLARRLSIPMAPFSLPFPRWGEH